MKSVKWAFKTKFPLGNLNNIKKNKQKKKQYKANLFFSNSKATFASLFGIEITFFRYVFPNGVFLINNGVTHTKLTLASYSRLT